MHRHNYERLRSEVWQAEMLAEERLDTILERLKRMEGRPRTRIGRRPDANGWRRRRCGGRFALLTATQQRHDQADGRQYMRAAGEFSRHANLHQACAFVLTGSFNAMVASGDFRQLLPVPPELRTSCWRWPTPPGSAGSRPSARGPCRLPGGRCPPPPRRGNYRTGRANDCEG